METTFLIEALPAAASAPWRNDPDAAEYLQQLASMPQEELVRCPEQLEDEQRVTTRETKQLAFENYKTFIQTANATTDIFRDFNTVQTTTDSLLEKLPNFSKACRSFLAEADAISVSRQQTTKALKNQTQVLEVLEIPQLMDTCVRNAYYEEALQLQAHVNQMHKRHPDIDVIAMIADDVLQHSAQMQRNLLTQLRSDVQLPACLKVIGYLRRLNVYTELELRVQFLQARDSWLQKTLKAISPTDAYTLITKTVENCRVHLFDIITQYKAVFSTASERFGTDVGSEGLLAGWILRRVTDFIEILEEHLPRLRDRFNTVLGQCMHFALSLGRVGMDFRPLLAPLFQRTIATLFSQRVELAVGDFGAQLPSMALVAHAALPDTDPSDAIADSPIAPLSLMSYPILARLTNNLLSALNDLRECAPLAIGIIVAQKLSDNLVNIAEQLATFHALHSDTFTQSDRENFSGLTQMFFDAMVPCIVCCLDTIYPETAFKSSATKGPAAVIDRTQIAQPLVQFCPTAEAFILSEQKAGHTKNVTPEMQPAKNVQAEHIPT